MKKNHVLSIPGIVLVVLCVLMNPANVKAQTGETIYVPPGSRVIIIPEKVFGSNQPLIIEPKQGVAASPGSGPEAIVVLPPGKEYIPAVPPMIGRWSCDRYQYHGDWGRWQKKRYSRQRDPYWRERGCW